MLRLRSNWTTTSLTPSVLSDVNWVMPEIWENWRSSGAATDAAMVSALAPARNAVTWTVGKSICGKEATGRNGNAVSPTNAMAAVSSEVATGRWMNGSEMFT